MDDNRDPRVPVKSSEEEKKNEQNSQDELTRLTKPDERSNIDASPNLQSVFPENLDESLSSVDRSTPETVKYVSQLSVEEPTVEPTSLRGEKNNFTSSFLFERQKSKETISPITVDALLENLRTSVTEMHEIAVEALLNKKCVFPTKEANKNSAQEPKNSAQGIISLLPEEGKRRDPLISANKNHTNSVCSLDHSQETSPSIPFSENAKRLNITQTGQTKFASQNLIDTKRFSDRGCQTDHIKILNNQCQTDRLRVFDAQCQTDPINCFEHQTQINFEKFIERNICATAYSNRHSGALERSECVSDVLEYSLCNTDTSEHSGCESSIKESPDCESVTADISESQTDTEEFWGRQTHSEHFLDSQKNFLAYSDNQADASEHSDSQADVSELSSSQTDASEILDNREVVSQLSDNTTYASELSNSPTVSTDFSDYSARASNFSDNQADSSNSSDSRKNTSELPDDQIVRSNFFKRETDYFNLSDSQTHTTDLSDSMTDVSESSEDQNDFSEVLNSRLYTTDFLESQFLQERVSESQNEQAQFLGNQSNTPVRTHSMAQRSYASECSAQNVLNHMMWTVQRLEQEQQYLRNVVANPAAFTPSQVAWATQRLEQLQRHLRNGVLYNRRVR